MKTEWKISPDEAFMRSVDMILSRKPTPNTYKFAVMRALADSMQGRRFSARDPMLSGLQTEVVSIETIASHVVRYYWPIVLAYRLRQSIDPSREPDVMQMIRDEAAELALGPQFECWRYRAEYPERYTALVSQCCTPRSSLIDAISRIHVVTYYRVDPKLFKLRGRDLHLTGEAVAFFSCYRQAVEQISIASWVAFTEQLTSSPRLHLKIAKGPTRLGNENDRKKYERILGELWGDICFYCAQRSPEADISVDHLVPFTYLLGGRIWNVVLACEACARAKGEQTPPDRCVEKLIVRNRELIALLQRSDVGLGNRDTHELKYFGPRIAEHLRGLIEECRGDGFGTWADPERI